MKKSKIILIEDEPTIADTVIYALETEGYIAVWGNMGSAGLKLAETESADLVLLDIGLPDINGFEVFQKLRQFTQVPVIFLTARKEEIDKVTGLEMGADDYVVKPFSPRELTARVRAVLRRSQYSGQTDMSESESDAIYTAGPFSIDTRKWIITFQSVELDLTQHEFEILHTLSKSPGQIFSREQLLEAIWDAPEHRLDRTVDTHIKNIRAKLRKISSQPEPIKTKRGIGYFANWN